MNYDSYKLATPPEYDTLGSESDDVECVHGIDLFEPCAKCKPMAAHSGEGDDMQDMDKQDPKQCGGDEYFTRPLDQYTPYELAAMSSRIEAQLDRFEELADKLKKDVSQARSGKTAPRATRRDKGTTRAKENAA